MDFLTSQQKQNLEQARQWHRQGSLSEAEKLFRELLAAHPAEADILHELGIVALQQGQLPEAVSLIRQALVSRPGFPLFWHSLGNALKEQGDLDGAIASYQQCLAKQPQFALAHRNLADAYRRQMHFDLAIQHYQQAISCQPDYAIAYHDMGNVYQLQGHYDMAMFLYQQALRYQPSLAIAYNNIGNILQKQGRYKMALYAYQQALELEPACEGLLMNMGLALQQVGQLSAARCAFLNALETAQAPQRVHIYANLASVLQSQGHLGEAQSYYEKFLASCPQDAALHSKFLCFLRGVPSLAEAELFAHFQEWDQRHGAPLKPSDPCFPNPPDPGRRLRVGYVSAAFCQHSVAPIFELLLSHHHPDEVEVFLFANIKRPDQGTARFQALYNHWLAISGLPDEDVAALIRHYQIDILVDLDGHTPQNRLLLFARQPAPIQVTGLGLGHTTGLAAMDYRLADPWLSPPETLPYNSEQVMNMTTMMHFIAPDESAEVAPPPCLHQEGVVFGCGNDLFKINQEVIETWSQLLAQDPSFRLKIKASSLDDPETCGLYLSHFARQGISPNRIGLLGKTDRARHLAFYHEIDIALDPFPYNGGATLLETAWMGVPTIALAGGTRTGLSILSVLGHPEWVAASRPEYVQLALALAHDRPRLRDLRTRLRAELLASPLCDGELFARETEAAYRRMWQSWCARPEGG